MKTMLEEIRPIFVRKQEHTRGHVFVVMLAYMVIKNVSGKLSELNYSRKFIFESLDKIHYLTYTHQGRTMNIAPNKLLPHQEEIIKKLNLQLD